MFPWRVSGAGVVFTTTFRREICLVFGREKNKTKKVGYDLYEDFGGGIDKGETIKQAAMRESYEETCRTIKLKNIKDKVIINMPTFRYGLFFVRLPNNFFTKFRRTFKKNRKELERIDEDRHFLEIDEIKLIPLKNFIDKSKYKIVDKKGYYSRISRSVEIETVNKEKIILGGRLTQLFYPKKKVDRKVLDFIKSLNITDVKEIKKGKIITFTQYNSSYNT